MSDQRARTEVQTREGEHRLVQISVNEQAVELQGPRTTGLEIKEAAIRAGVQIDPSFQLIEELSHGRTRVIGNQDLIEVRPGSRFLALAPDDNS
jgi:hypothetical protein